MPLLKKVISRDIWKLTLEKIVAKRCVWKYRSYVFDPITQTAKKGWKKIKLYSLVRKNILTALPPPLHELKSAIGPDIIVTLWYIMLNWLDPSFYLFDAQFLQFCPLVNFFAELLPIGALCHRIIAMQIYFVDKGQMYQCPIFMNSNFLLQ